MNYKFQVLIPTEEEAIFIAGCFLKKDFKLMVDDGIMVEGTCYKFLGADYKQFKTVLGSKEGHGAITLHSSKTGSSYLIR